MLIGSAPITLVGISSVQQSCISRCLFEDFSIVIQSVRKGIDVQVNVSPLVIGVDPICERVFVGALNDTGTRDAESVVACFLLAIQLMVADWKSIAGFDGNTPKKCSETRLFVNRRAVTLQFRHPNRSRGGSCKRGLI
jgi:hypothetical protein